MAGIDYEAVKAQVSIARVLDLLGFVAGSRSGDQVRGPCPVHGSESEGSTVFSVNLAQCLYRCFKCGSAGNQLQLWAAVKKMPLYEAVLDLCRQAGVEVPWVHKW